MILMTWLRLIVAIRSRLPLLCAIFHTPLFCSKFTASVACGSYPAHVRFQIEGSSPTRVPGPTGYLSTRLRLTEAFIAAEVSVVMLDPLMGTVDGKTDIYRNNETRDAVLTPWSRLADKISGLVIGIAHLTKAPSGDIVAAIQGSSAFGEVARSVFGVAKDNDGNRIMSQAKNSGGREDLALEYAIDPVEVITDTGNRAEVARLEITGKSDRNVGDVLREQARGGRGSGGGGAAVGRWLAEYLADGPRWAAAGIAAGEREGYSKDRLKRARLDCGIESVRDGKAGRWYWATAEQITAEQKPGTDEPVTLADPAPKREVNPFPGPMRGTPTRRRS